MVDHFLERRLCRPLTVDEEEALRMLYRREAELLAVLTP
jgi:hypothetical protein